MSGTSVQITPLKVELVTQNYLVQKAAANDRKYDIFHPSAWGGCLRKVAYQYYNGEEQFVIKRASNISLKGERIFDNGHSVHARWQKYLDGSGVLRGYWKCTNPMCNAVYGEKEKLGILNPLRKDPCWKCRCGNNISLEYQEIRVKSDTTYNFDGHCDAVIDFRGTPYERQDKYDLIVVDFKSIKDEHFADITEYKPKHEHVVQVNIYMWILDLHGSVVLYENKNTQMVKEIFVPRDDKLIENVKEQAIWMRNVLKDKKLPNRPDGVSPSRMPCRFCEFAAFCWR